MASDNNSLLTNPSWPSLYNPRSELFDIQHHDPIQPGGFYLLQVTFIFNTNTFASPDVFRFTLYWTLTFYIPVFFVFGSYAFLNLTFPPKKDQKRAFNPTSATATHPFLPVSSAHVYPPPAASLAIGNTSKKINKPFQGKPEKPTKPKNAARSRITFALLVFFGFLLLSLIGAVVSSAIVGYILTGLYKAGKFYMSTWVPFLWAAISVMVGMLNVWPSVINLI
ncbi:hypothetical protein J3R30DRAFT_3659411 [Lentinula aciculospora]|uniref:Uncharacterized protein n=1 Tax=Lentinula aciculospora TaxID=153920 RepID=A0A9W9DJ89_9AGAR|nr:hypothetical protein J3R30DRAFT_3659411 [Lentinula aciculospora]